MSHKKTKIIILSLITILATGTMVWFFALRDTQPVQNDTSLTPAPQESPTDIDNDQSAPTSEPSSGTNESTTTPATNPDVPEAQLHDDRGGGIPLQ